MKTQLGMCLFLAARAAWGGEVTGRILLDDKPAAGVTVSALAVELPADQGRREARREPRPAPVAKAVTNSKGEFLIVFEGPRGQPGQLVSLACSGGGAASAWLPGRFDTAESDDAGEFAASKGVALAGRVVDAAGKPVADAEVEHPTGPEDVRTGADGGFVLEGVPERGNDVAVRAPGFAGMKVTNLRGGRKDVSIVLKAAVQLSGVVVTRDGGPVAGAVVRVDGRDASGWAETDADGKFVVAAFGAGRVAVFADGGEKGVREATGIALPRPGGEPLRLVLGPARVLAGRVVDATTRKPVARAVLEVSGAGRGPWTRAGTDGTFTLRPSLAGDFRLTAIAPRFVATARPVTRAAVGGKPVEWREHASGPGTRRSGVSPRRRPRQSPSRTARSRSGASPRPKR